MESKPASASHMSLGRILKEHHSDLRRCLSLPQLIPLLRRHKLLTAEECDEISRKQTHQQKIDYLVQLLSHIKGENAYEKFISCLESAEHPSSSHMQIAFKMRMTAAMLTSCPSPHNQQLLQKPAMDELVEQVTDALKSNLSKYTQSLKDRIASLETQLQEKDMLIAHVQKDNGCACHATAEVVKFQELLSYANGPHGSKEFNMHILAKHYREIREILKKVKGHLLEDVGYVNRNIEAASEDSDVSREPSMVSSGHPHPMPCTTPSYETLKEFVTSRSSSVEIDDVNVPTEEVYTSHQEELLMLQSTTSSGFKARHPGCYSDSQTRKQFSEQSCYQSEEDTISDTEVFTLYASNDDTPTIDMEAILDQEKSSAVIKAGYLQKEGNAKMWKRRYFRLTMGFLFYYNSEQDSEPLAMIPLINLKLEKKEKTTYTFEVINKNPGLIKVNKPARKNVQSYEAIKLRASSEAEMMTWVTSIEDSIKRINNSVSMYM